MKRKSNSRAIALILAAVSIITASVPALTASAAPSSGSLGTDIAVLDNSEYDVAGKDTKQNKKSEYELYTLDGDDIISSVNVYATVVDGGDVYDPDNPDADENGFVNGDIQVGVPTTIIVDGTPDSEGYYIGEASGKVKGNISGTTVIKVVPDDEVTLSSEGKNDVTAPIEQDYTQFVVPTSEFSGAKVNKHVTPSFNDKAVFDVSVKTKDLSAGSWQGSFNYNIEVTNTTIAALGNRVKSWNISATENDDVWMSYYQEPTRSMSAPTRGGTTIDKFEDGTVVVSGTGNMEDSVNSHFYDIDAMTEKLTSLIWQYLKDNYSDEEYSAITSEIAEGTETWYYKSAYSLDHRNTDRLSGAVKTKLTTAFNNSRSKIYASSYVKYVPKRIIILDGVTNVSEGAFNGCSAVTEVSLGNTIKAIENSAFTNCSSLTELTIPEGCEKIGNGLSARITSVRFPASVKTIAGGMAFAYNTIVIDEANPYFTIVDGIIYSKDKKTLVALTRDASSDIVVLEGVETINNYVFQKRLNSVTLPASLTSMGYDVFGSISDLEVICKSQGAYDIMQALIQAKQNTGTAFRGTVTLSVD